MQQDFKEKLDTANKLIFVRAYEDAEKVLRSCIAADQFKWESLVHLRRIELMSLLGRLDALELEYAAESKSGNSPWPRLYLTLTQLFNLKISPQAALTDVLDFVAQHGPSAVAYFTLAYACEQNNEGERARHYYELSLSQNPDWYPSLFGLSQVHYNLGDDSKGDQYFHQFETLAPYNVYGNFDTHRKLSQEFYLKGQFDNSEKAIQMLTSWWVDNKGYAPVEIQVYEMLSTYRIAELRGDHTLADQRKERAVQMATELLSGNQVDENVLYFLARILEEFGEQALAFKAYKQVLRLAGDSPNVVQKVGSHFLGSKGVELALELFEHAYESHPDNSEVRFCRLVARLRHANTAVEEYLAGRERIRALFEHGDKVELLALLNQLQQTFQDDWDVHYYFGELFLKIGQVKKAGQHFKRMYELDPLGQVSRLRYANFLINSDQYDAAMEILSLMASKPQSVWSSTDIEAQWLRVVYYDRKGEWQACWDQLSPLLSRDPWNISYLVQEILTLTGLKFGGDAVAEARQVWADKVSSADDSKINWNQFSKDTAALSAESVYGLIYARRKLHFLYVRGSHDALKGVVKAACMHDASSGAKDLMKLMNTNFDSPAVYFGLGLLYKELWQLEVASMWFEHTLQMAGLDDTMKSRLYAELADVYTWRQFNLPKAIEFCRLALDIGAANREDEKIVLTAMAHALLKHGQPRQAFAFIEQLLTDDPDHFEVRYLNGLVRYRNGHPKEANEIWKPLLKYRAEHLREHKIKQEILKYYFEGVPYQPVDLSKAN